MDTHIRNGPIGALKLLFVRLKGARTILQQRRCSSISEKKQASHQTKHPECSKKFLDKNQIKQEALSIAGKDGAYCSSSKFAELYRQIASGLLDVCQYHHVGEAIKVASSGRRK